MILHFNRHNISTIETNKIKFTIIFSHEIFIFVYIELLTKMVIIINQERLYT